MEINGVLKSLIFIASVSVFIISCDKIGPPSEVKYSVGIFPSEPVNLVEINTLYDDYNSDIPVFLETFPFCFSSNRNSKGGNYDIVYKLMTIEFSKINGKLKFFENSHTNLDVFMENENIKNALTKINTNFDEFGPCLIPQGRNSSSSNLAGSYESYVFMYSSNQGGNQDIFFTQNLENENYEGPVSIAYLNSAFDDAYPAFNKTYTELYFTSNRSGDFDIYKIKTDSSKHIIEILTEINLFPVERDTMLSSGYDDKCPSIKNNIIVFASNRPGGYGGYDLYYSYLENEAWSVAVNFGSKINTGYDEFRPIVRSKPRDFENDLMIFSSDRPGGKGGFDLYFVGIQRD